MPSHLAIVDYGSGNLRSAAKAFERAARETGREIAIDVTSDPDIVTKADRIVVPGVGAFADCRNGLVGVDGMIEALDHACRWTGRPILGICVGMQLMGSWGHEHGNTEGLGWIEGHVHALSDRPGQQGPHTQGLHTQRSGGKPLKLPHMGWNALALHEDHPLFADLPEQNGGPHAYFVHSYHFMAGNPAHVLATADYGGSFAAVIGRDTLVGTQFHPEKSQAVGLALLRNFLTWRP